MNTVTVCIIAYCAICALIIVFVPVVRNTWKQSISPLISTVDKNFNSKQYTLFKKILFMSLLVIIYSIVVSVVFLLTPFLIPKFNKDEKKNKQIESTQYKVDKQYEKDKLFFWHLGGAGNIYCKDCGHKERNVTSFIHGFDEEGNSDGSSGYQCQSCGQFCTLDGETERNTQITCSCGSEFSSYNSNQYIPRCHSCGKSDLTPDEYDWLFHGGRCSCGGSVFRYAPRECLSCGNSDLRKATIHPYKCSCGGELSRGKALFCSQCKSYSIGYKMGYIT